MSAADVQAYTARAQQMLAQHCQPCGGGGGSGGSRCVAPPLASVRLAPPRDYAAPLAPWSLCSPPDTLCCWLLLLAVAAGPGPGLVLVLVRVSHSSQGQIPGSSSLDRPGEYRVIKVPFAGVEEPRPLLIYEDVNAGPGGRVWNSSVAMCQYLATRPNPAEMVGASVVEIGAGTGAPGMVAALMGSAVTLTDRARMATLLNRNAALVNQAIACGCSVVAADDDDEVGEDGRGAAGGDGTAAMVRTGNDGGPKQRRQFGYARFAVLEWGGSISRLTKQCPTPEAEWGVPVLPVDLILASDVVGCGDATLFPPLIKVNRCSLPLAPQC
jgi:hypothetical protein